MNDLEVLIRTAKRCNDSKSREYECALEEVQKNVKTLTVEDLRNLFVALVGDPVKSSVVQKANRAFKIFSTAYPLQPPAGPSPAFGRPFLQLPAPGPVRRRGGPTPLMSPQTRYCYACYSPDHLIRQCPSYRGRGDARGRFRRS